MKINFGKITYIGETPLEFGKGLRIEYDEAPPVSLFKYYSPSNHNFLSVSKGEFYASHPYQFNDLTDSNPLSYDFTNLSFDNFKKLYEPVVKIGRLKNEDVKNMFDIDAANGFK
ncbi:hypothetical protein AMR72_11935 [Flavobacterium psychrophilum]|nr:hypothetical protein AMR72_11935 [Flavobacterium psychrophilum]AOE53167.1 hypothetical protein ALW18_11925 [Flavobacterium psychrophilum]